jgi:hypothetical protein
MEEGALIVNMIDDAVPDTGTLPVPLQPVQMYCVPAEPGVGLVTESVTLEPESNQPLDGEGES